MASPSMSHALPMARCRPDCALCLSGYALRQNNNFVTPPPSTIQAPNFNGITSIISNVQYRPNPAIPPSPRWYPIPTPSPPVHKLTRKGRSTTPLVNRAFPLFRKLPPEIRLRIWSLAASVSRILEIRSWSSSSSTHAPIKFSVTPHTLPSILHVSRESRLEALRIYQLVQIGVSTWSEYNPSLTYIPWRYHPQNQHADREYQVCQEWRAYDRGVEIRGEPDEDERTDAVMPLEPQKVYIDFNHDTIYLGPEFRPHHLERFLSASGAYRELRDLKYLALDHRLCIGRLDTFKDSLYALRTRPLKFLLIIPDDSKTALPDKYYYKKHKIRFLESEGPILTTMWMGRRVESSLTLAGDLGEWLERFWKVRGLMGPKVEWASVRRGKGSDALGDFRDGVWQVQEIWGDVRGWKTWELKS